MLPRFAPTFRSEFFGFPTRTCRIRTHSDTTSGTYMSESNLPEWEQLLSAAAHYLRIPEFREGAAMVMRKLRRAGT